MYAIDCHYFPSGSCMVTCSWHRTNITFPYTVTSSQSSPLCVNVLKTTRRTEARFPFKRNRLRCVRCVNENRKKRKRLRFLRFSFMQRTQRKRLRLNGNRAWLVGSDGGSGVWQPSTVNDQRYRHGTELASATVHHRRRPIVPLRWVPFTSSTDSMTSRSLHFRSDKRWESVTRLATPLLRLVGR